MCSLGERRSEKNPPLKIRVGMTYEGFGTAEGCWLIADSVKINNNHY